MDEKQLQKLIRKNLNDGGQGSRKPPAKQYDPTLVSKDETDTDRDKFFDEMKKREF